MATYTIKEYVVSDANPSEFEFSYDTPTNAVSMLRYVTQSVANNECDERSEYAPEYDVRTTRIVIEIHH